ncbi:MAG: flagellar type III secretion system pore protein FliP [Acidimicrobiia bacterium]|nr:flagellar type III secretion system pore protein FliP [Acidimicrobiia bacterium]
MTRLLLPLLACLNLAAAPAGNAGGIFGPASANGGSFGVPMQIVLMLAALTLLPAFVMSVTPFLRIVLVLHFLRQALGTQTAPSNQVLVGLSLFLTVLLMQPVIGQVQQQAWTPMQNGEIGIAEAAERAAVPLRSFLLKYAREKDTALMLELAKAPAPRSPADLELKVLIPAYVLSELKTGFQIGAVVFLPFLVIDLVVASVTLAIGMVQLPPVMLSAPFKVLLFVLVDGWNLVVGSLVKSF